MPNVPTWLPWGMAAESSESPPETADLAEPEQLLAASESARERGDHLSGSVFAEKAAELAFSQMQEPLAAQAVTLLALHRFRLGDFVAAVLSGRQALELHQRLDDVAAQTSLHSMLALVHTAVGLFDEALLHGSEALRLANFSGDRVAQCWATSRLACVYDSMNDLPRALEAGRRALEMSRSVSAVEVVFACLNNLGGILVSCARNDREQGLDDSNFSEEAIVVATEALRVAELNGNFHWIALSGAVWADALIAAERARDATVRLVEFREMALVHGFTSLVIDTDLSTIRALRSIGNSDAALVVATSVAELIETDQDPNHLLSINTILYELWKELGNLEKALAHHEIVLRVTTETFQRSASVQSQILLNGIELTQAQHTAEIEHLRAEELHRLAHTDALTGLGNRREVERKMPLLLDDAARSEHCMSAAIFDIDHFKIVNDMFGHEIGDAVLERIGAILTNFTRPEDLVARTGGEEFLVVLAGSATDTTAEDICERLRTEIAAYPWASLAPALAITVSIGLSTFSPGENRQAWLTRSDAALYEAKRQGRNRLVTA
jgi:diguanylate cyclase (GGDEF)-like protein